MELVHADAEVRRGQAGVLHVRHGTIGAAADGVLARRMQDLVDRVHDGIEDFRVLLDGRGRVDVQQPTTTDLTADAVRRDDVLGDLDNQLVELGKVLGIEGSRHDLGLRMNGGHFPHPGHVDERCIAPGNPGSIDDPSILQLGDEPRHRVVGRLEVLAVSTRMSALAEELDDRLPAVEAAGVDHLRIAAVERDESAPRTDDLRRHDANLELSDLLVHAEVQVDGRMVGDGPVGQVGSDLAEDGHTSFVVGTERGQSVRGHDRALLVGEILLRDDDIPLGQDDVTTVVLVDDARRTSGGFRTGVHVSGIADRLAVHGALEAHQHRAVLEVQELAFRSAAGEQVLLDHRDQGRLADRAGVILLIHPGLGVDGRILEKQIQHRMTVHVEPPVGVVFSYCRMTAETE